MTPPPSMVAFEEALAEFTSIVTTQLKGQVELNALLTERVLRLEQRLDNLQGYVEAMQAAVSAGGKEAIHAA